MHHSRSITAIPRFRIAALLFVGNYLLALVAASLLIHALMIYNRQLAMNGLILMILSPVFVVAQ